jgi:hypothetical protein
VKARCVFEKPILNLCCVTQLLSSAFKAFERVKESPMLSPSMTEPQMMQAILEHVNKQFPKRCNCCRRVFLNYQDYLLNTEHAGVPVSYDLEMNDLKPRVSSGNLALANCHCGNTLAISSKGMSLKYIWQILLWVKMEASRRGVSQEVIICYIRDTVEKMALS